MRDFFKVLPLVALTFMWALLAIGLFDEGRNLAGAIALAAFVEAAALIVFAVHSLDRR